jgi:inosose dehydratase
MNRREFVLAVGALGSTVVRGQGSRNGKLRIGCQTNAWKIDVPEFRNLLTVLDEIKRLGFDGFETGYRNVQGQFQNLKEAGELIRKSGLRFYGCHIFQFEYDPKTNIPAWELMERVARGISELGAERLIVSGAPVGTDAERLRWKIGALGRAGRLCRDLKMGKICYHNHGPEFDHGAAEMTAMIKETDPENVRFLIDCGHALRRKADLVSFFRKHHKRIDGLHLRDFKGDAQVPLGQGDFDYAPLAAAIQRTGWQGWILNEEERESGEKPGAAAVEPARAHIRKLFNA